jgi:hypothetical protein
LTRPCPIGYKGTVTEHLFIVSRQQVDLYRYLTQEFSSEADVHVILDRRQGDRRTGGERRTLPGGERRTLPGGERRRAERRGQSEIGRQLNTLGYAFVRLS